MTYMRNKYEPILFGGTFGSGNSGGSTAGPGNYPAWYPLAIPRDVRSGDIIHIFYQGYCATAGTATPGLYFKKTDFDAGTADLNIDYSEASDFSVVQKVDGDTDMEVNNPSGKTGKASLTVNDEVASWAQGVTKDGDATYTISSNVVTVSSTAHGLSNSDYVYIRDPASTVVITEGAYQITSVADADTFTFAFTASDQGSATAIRHSLVKVDDAGGTVFTSPPFGRSVVVALYNTTSTAQWIYAYCLSAVLERAS